MTDSKSKSSNPPILISHLPTAEKAARKAFTEIQNNTYENKSLGKSKQAEDSFPCECSYDGDSPSISEACGEHADCINRLTQTECLEHECRSKSHCQNQRFQRKQYAALDIVQTDQKGFGLRAATDLKTNDFIYEYVGEVVTEGTLMKRMRAYANEGIEHFYFMMLQKGEFIDATKRGGIGRFANHSCNPNSYVAKWYVGKRIRMGIFAKRAIVKDEEITFNYNVDRYGHEAQPCYCGESNCVGFIGGKTQTEVAMLDDVYVQALGLDEEQLAELEINVPKKARRGARKSAKDKEKEKENKDPFEELELNVQLKPLQVKEVPAVVNAIRKSLGSNRTMLGKFMSRVEMTDDLPSLKQFPRLRGLGLMADVLEENPDDVELAIMVLNSVIKWPLVNRIKIEDVGFEEKIQPYLKSEDDTLRDIASKIMEKWSQLEKGYRIPRRALDDADDVPTITHITLDDVTERPRKRPKFEQVEDFVLPPPLPNPPEKVNGKWALNRTKERRHFDYAHQQEVAKYQPKKLDIKLILSRAWASSTLTTEEIWAGRRVPETHRPKEAANAKAAESASGSASERVIKEKKSGGEKANRDKRLMKLIGEVVVRSVSKYAKQMGTDMFKKYAKEVTTAIAEKEKKSSGWPTMKLDKLPDEKTHKIKKYAREFFAKAMAKVEKKRKEKAALSASSNGSSSRRHSSSTIDPRKAGSSKTNGVDIVTPGSDEAYSVSGSAQRDDLNVNEEAMDGELLEDVMGSMMSDEDADGSDLDGSPQEGEGDRDEEETLRAEQTQTPNSISNSVSMSGPSGSSKTLGRSGSDNMDMDDDDGSPLTGIEGELGLPHDFESHWNDAFGSSRMGQVKSE